MEQVLSKNSVNEWIQKGELANMLTTEEVEEDRGDQKRATWSFYTSIYFWRL